MTVTPRGRHAPVSEATTHRLSLLLRCLRILDGEGVGTISSRLLEERFGMNSAQIRKDLAQFGEFGVRGVGYRIPVLRDRLRGVLGLDRARIVVVAGAGNLGLALADSRNFNSPPFRVAALFDVDPAKVGTASRTGIPILAGTDIARQTQALGAEIGVVAVPAEAAGPTAAALVAGGARAIRNFAPTPLGPFRGVALKNVDLTLFLDGLSYLLAASEPAPPAPEP